MNAPKTGDRAACQGCGHTISYHEGSGKWNHVNTEHATECPGPKYPRETYEPTMYQRLTASNDTNGNPRRCFVVLNSTGDILDVIDEGYAGRPRWLTELVQLPEIRVSGKEYRALLTHAAVRAS